MNRALRKKTIHDELDLRAEPMPDPPDGLADAIRREIPERLDLAPELAPELEGPRREVPGWRPPARWMLAAASVILAVGAGVVALRVFEGTPETLAPSPAEVTLPAAPETAATSSAAEEAQTRAQAAASLRLTPPAPPRARAEADSAGSLAAATPGATPGQVEQQDRARTVTREPQKVAVPPPPAARRAPAEAGTESPVRTEYEFESHETLAPVAPKLAEGVVVPIPETPPPRSKAQDAELKKAEARKIPTPRDPWSVVTRSPGATSDRINVGGNLSGQQAVFTEPEVAAPAGMAPSTGGTAEPNDQPYGDVFFQSYGTNPFVDTEDDPLSTFGLDVDTGSWGVVRRYLTDGHLPPHEAVRVEELINAFDYGDAPPAEGDFALYAEGSRSPFGETARYHLIRFGLKARVVDPADRKSAVLTFVVDVSGSMGYGNRLGLVKQALGLLLDHLRPDDRVALVVYGSNGRVLLGHTADHEAIRRAIGQLRPEGATNAEEGLEIGYSLARRDFRPGAINRVILCSDGVANVGATGPGSILARIGDEARQGIELTTVGFGMGNYNDVLMEQLADRGDGAYAYVDSLDEARRVFVENLTGTLQTVARDAKVQVEFDPEVVERYRLIGYENRDVPDERFRDDTVDAGEVGAGHGVTALYEVKLRPGTPGRRTAATLRLRYRSVASGRVEELAKPITARELEGSWNAAPRSLRLASVVAELGEILEGSYWARRGDLDDLFRRAQRLAAEYPGDVRVSELATLIGKAARLAPPATPRSPSHPEGGKGTPPPGG